MAKQELTASRSSSATDPIAQKLLRGHYVGSNKLIGLTLDRTNTPATLQIDGSDEVITLTPKPGAYGRTEWVRTDGRIPIWTYPDGRVTFFNENLPAEGVSLWRDSQNDSPTCCHTAEPSKVRKDQSFEVKLKLGHYRNGEKTIGFVLDRTKKSPGKLKIDGSEEIILLTPEPGPYQRTQWKKGNGSIPLYTYEDGRVVFFHEGLPAGGVDMYRDADADPL